nr:adhesin [Streptomyces sp. NBC_00857]
MATAALVALGCVGATVAAVAGTGGGGAGAGTGAESRPVPSGVGVGPPQLPGFGGGSSPSGNGGASNGASDGPSASTGPSGKDPGESPDPEPDPGRTPGGGRDGDLDPGPGFSAWAGPGCATGRYTEKGRVENGDAAWYTVTSGGHKGDSCDGRFSAVPMSGIPDKDTDSTATWSWKLGKRYAKCALAIFVPDSDRDRDVAGSPSVYRVLADPKDGDTAYATFGVRQTVHRGSLVKVGSYRVKGTSFSVRMFDRGQDWGSADLVGAHHAAAQMKVDCR